jgi:hypothetical protein
MIDVYPEKRTGVFAVKFQLEKILIKSNAFDIVRSAQIKRDAALDTMLETAQADGRDYAVPAREGWEREEGPVTETYSRKAVVALLYPEHARVGELVIEDAIDTPNDLHSLALYGPGVSEMAIFKRIPVHRNVYWERVS